MTPEERAYHILNENKKQYESEDHTCDSMFVNGYIIGYQVGRHEMKEVVKEHIIVPWEKIDRECDR